MQIICFFDLGSERTSQFLNYSALEGIVSYKPVSYKHIPCGETSLAAPASPPYSAVTETRRVVMNSSIFTGCLLNTISRRDLLPLRVLQKKIKKEDEILWKNMPNFLIPLFKSLRLLLFHSKKYETIDYNFSYFREFKNSYLAKYCFSTFPPFSCQLLRMVSNMYRTCRKRSCHRKWYQCQQGDFHVCSL